MARICERPTCTQPADVSYGIDPYQLVVTIEAFDDERSRRAGVLCRGHADSMVVPNGWTLDDRRESAPRLFPSRESVEVKPRRRRIRRRRLTDDDTGQMRLAVDYTASDHDLVADPVVNELVADVIDLAKPRSPRPAMAPWQPVFDQTDDLDGLLSARGPLLSRAFGKRGKRPVAQEGRPSESRSKGPRAV